MERAEVDRIVDRLDAARARRIARAEMMDGHRRARTRTDEHAGAGLVLVVPVGRDLALLDARLAGLEQILRGLKKHRGAGGGTGIVSEYWLQALRGAELKSSKAEGTERRADPVARFLAALGMTREGAGKN